MKWGCTSECTAPTSDDVHATIELKEAFDKPIQEVQHAYDSDCPNQHYTKIVDNAASELQGHPLVCSNDGGCHSKMRILSTFQCWLHYCISYIVQLTVTGVCTTLTMLCVLVTTLSPK